MLGFENFFWALSGCSLSHAYPDDTFTTFAVSERKGKSSSVRLIGPKRLIFKHSFEKDKFGVRLCNSSVLLTPALLMSMSILIFSFSIALARSFILCCEATSRYMHFTRFSLSISFQRSFATSSCYRLVAYIWEFGFFLRNCLTSSFPIPLLVPVISTFKGLFINFYQIYIRIFG